MTTPLAASSLPLRRLHSGKVRDVYEVDAEHLLLVASDRISAFDVVMEQPIPRKGEVLTLITAWWLHQLEGIGVEHHLVSVNPNEIEAAAPELADHRNQWARRAMLVHRTDPVPIECVIRGYLSGSAWKEYRESGTLAGEALPEGLVESDRLDPPLFSPATKAERGEHDENITIDVVRRTVGDDLTAELERRAHAIYDFGRAVCEPRGIILADTKFEFGHSHDGRLLLIDEVLTPDSSRFWPAEHYSVGRGQPSLDKQPLRDWLESLEEWAKTPPPPPLPDEIVAVTSARYIDTFQRLTGSTLDGWEV